MGFQSSVNTDAGFGVIGEIFLEGPLRAQPANIYTADATKNVVGRAFTVTNGADSSGDAITVVAGGTGKFAGILGNPKIYASVGTSAGGTLAATLTVPNYTIGEFITETAGMVITLPSAADVGYWVEYHQTTGVLNAIAAGASPSATSTIIAGAIIERYDVASGLAVMSLGTPSTVTVEVPAP